MGVGFGAFVPQGWKTEYAGIDPQEAWAKTRAVALAAETLGYDSIWVYDHFHTIPRPTEEPVFECWTTMAALAEATERIRLGQMVGCMSYRNPALLAKITSNIDVISGGRLEWGIGAGWYHHEYNGYGFDFATAGSRLKALREGVEVVKSMWSQPSTSYSGEVFTLEDARCDPKPVQSPHPPVWIGGGGEKVTLKIVAEHADWSNFGGKYHEFEAKCEILKGHCESVGRDYDEIGKSIHQDCFVRETEAEVEEWLSSADGGSMWGEPAESYTAGNLVGTPEQIAERIQGYLDLGASYFILWFRDFPDTASLELFASKVIPEFR